ncbi:hypothetical protein DAEQUDRAFT_608980 [Daedalea quercina L-15889]|uniref:Uncharacterized protein n=1 Tax=Daedalea quercina L-15889 TaxID=1314783 RepID=A0A165LIJ6_9APHY|nr:hypothetical protein DAEQUDRAFT_608980 [Daedalea quercina L-15889]
MILQRAYAYNLRPVVGVTALISAIWSLIACIGSFRSVTIDKDYDANKLASFGVVLGIIYAIVTGIETFGLLTAMSQRLPMARMYALLSVGSALAVVGAGFLRVIVHFTLKSALINECTQIAKGDVVVYEYGFWGPVFETKLNAQEAASYCNGVWSHDSAVEIISLIVEILLAGFFCSLAFAYYHQLLDPRSTANVTRRPGPAMPVPQRAFDDGPVQGFPAHYAPPYLGYDAPPEEHADAPYGAAKADEPYGGAKPPMYSEDDIATYGAYGDDAGAKAGDPFADFDAEGRGPRTGERGEFV